MPVAVSCGEPSGIGPDIILQSWLRREALALTPFYCHGDPAQLAARAKTLGLTVPLEEVDAGDSKMFPHALPVVPLSARLQEHPGEPVSGNAAGVVEAIDRGVADCFSGKAAALVTAPIAKKPLYEAGFRFPGHTEYLAELARRHTGKLPKPVMMIAGPLLRTIPVTIHIPLADVPSALTAADIIDTVTIADHDLRTRFGIAHPRIAIAGLNPHAGEGGTIGSEDEEIVRPAIEALQANGIEVTGPLPADTMFHAAARENYDVAVCMYHDQALIPAKALGFDDGVNVTLGLPFIRTSPDHGTAFALAGSGTAKIESFVAALRMAGQMANVTHV